MTLLAASTFLGAGVVGCGSPPRTAIPVGSQPAEQIPALRPPPSIAIGLTHGCGIRKDGGVACWGGDNRDQLGNGRLGYSTTPVVAPTVDGVVELAAGAFTTCVRTAAGRVWCWGGRRASAAEVLDDAVELAVATNFACARRTTGTVGCWQDGDADVRAIPGILSAVGIHEETDRVCSHLATGEERCDKWDSIAPTDERVRPPRVRFESPHATDPKDVRAWLAASKQTVKVSIRTCDGCPGVHHCALLPKGKVTCWGELGGGQSVPGFEDVQELAAGQAHLCARLRDGHVRCVGSDDAEQLVGRTPDEPVRNVLIEGIQDAVEIDAGLLHTCVRHRTGHVSCWGENYSGQLGDGTTIRRTTPVRVVGLTGVVELAAGLAHNCARLDDGGLRCWGWGESGQLGIEEPMGLPSATLVKVVGAPDTRAIASGFTHSCALSGDGRVRCWGQPMEGARCTPVALDDGGMTCTGSGNSCGRILDGRTDSHAAPWIVPDLADVAAIYAQGSTTCALTTRGAVRCFGAPTRCELTGRRIVSVREAGRVAGARTFGVGGGHFCVITEAGEVACWGHNEHGQLGDGTTTSRETPQHVPGLRGVIQLALGAAHSCALREDGRVQCWGFNVSGQLGNGVASDGQSSPVWVKGLDDATRLVAGQWHTCALRPDGHVVCWGENARRSLGDGTQVDRVEPTPVASSVEAIEIASSDYRVCVMDRNRRVTCWGDEDLVRSGPVVLP